MVAEEGLDVVGKEDAVLKSEGCSPVQTRMETLDAVELTIASSSTSLIKDGVQSRTETVLK